MSVDTIQNKEMMWKLMNENGIFNGIPDVYFENVKRDFENKIIFIKKTKNDGDNLVMLNKRLLTEMMNEMIKYKKKSQQLDTQPQVPPPHSQTQQLPIKLKPKQIINQSQNKTNEFLEKVSNKKKEFDDLIGNTPVEEIKFSIDLDDKPIGQEMEAIVADVISRRTYELNSILKNNTNNNQVQKQTEGEIEQREKLIKIGNDINLDKNTIIEMDVKKKQNNKKNVYFNDNILQDNNHYENDENENESENISTFFSILNSNTDNNNQNTADVRETEPDTDTDTDTENINLLFLNTKIEKIENQLDKILKNQELIMEKLLLISDKN